MAWDIDIKGIICVNLDATYVYDYYFYYWFAIVVN